MNTLPDNHRIFFTSFIVSNLGQSPSNTLRVGGEDFEAIDDTNKDFEISSGSLVACCHKMLSGGFGEADVWTHMGLEGWEKQQWHS